MMSAVQWELTLEKVAEWRDKKDDLPLAYGMLLVQISWGFGAVPADLESFIGSTGCSVARVLRRCPILQVRSWCVREASLGPCVLHATDWTRCGVTTLQDGRVLRAGLFSIQACVKSGVLTPSLKALLPWACTMSQGTLFEILAPVAVLWRRAVLLPSVRTTKCNQHLCSFMEIRCLSSASIRQVVCLSSWMMGLCAVLPANVYLRVVAESLAGCLTAGPCPHGSSRRAH